LRAITALGNLQWSDPEMLELIGALGIQINTEAIVKGDGWDEKAK